MGLIAVVTVMTSLVGPGAYGRADASTIPAITSAKAIAAAEATTTAQAGATAQASTSAKTISAKNPSLTELRRQAQLAYKGIEDATKTLEARQKQFEASQKQLATTLTKLQTATRQLNKMRKPLSDLVSSLYQDPSMSGISPFLSGTNGAVTLRSMSDLDYMVAGRNAVLGDAVKLLQGQERLAAQAQELRAANLLQEAQLNLQVDTLRKQSAKLVKTLTQSLVKLGVKINQGNRGAGACDPTRVSLAGQYPNGLLPTSILCPLPQRGEELRADAAIAFADLNIAYQRRFGRPICVSDSYRSLGEQQAVYYQRPGLAATPGKSNHGLGLAVDLCGGVQIFRSVQFTWLETNGKRYGWIHPDWAYHSPFEPWHWEYDPKVGNLL
ncbi:D-alanyl-D-alanine carboxypeptidase family protein [Microbispora sp. NPDC049125]|uniref:D-alanyl-D-alanine carboxypeptidase family protein n=1 Tax=Microbispora sp. NPDC049125 TaxID=3154929 RepID=UPI003467E38D